MTYRQSIFSPLPFAKPAMTGSGAAILLLTIYFAVVGLVSGLDFARDEFVRYWYFFLPLTLGFGIQAGLYTHLRNLVGNHGASGKAVAASGTTSGVAMVSCCAHYLVNAAPILGATGFIAVVAEYQTELFWVGLAFNAAGLVYVASKVVQATREHKKCETS